MENFDNPLNENPEQQDVTPQDVCLDDAPKAASAFEPIAAQPEQKKRSPLLRRTVAAVLALALVGASCGLTYLAVTNKWEEKNLLSSSTIEQLGREIETLQTRITRLSNVSPTVDASYEGTLTPRQLYAQNASSVVSISSTIKTVTYGTPVQGTSTGSGFVLTEDGYIVTNYHVVEGATEIQVIFQSGEEYTAELIGKDATNDVAVLKIDAHDLPAVKLGSSDDLYIGDMVCAIGNPLGSLTATLTVGYVSGKNREINTDNSFINMIQTDAAINSGNSGGPLFNMYGEVVGITTAKYSGTTTSGASIEGIGFAIPIDDVMSIIGDLRDYGYVTGAYLGVTVKDTDATAASVYGLPTGAYVVTVVEDGSAYRAGIQEKDIIIALGDYEVSNVNELTRSLRHFKAGDTTTITVIRSGVRETLTITLDEKPRDLDTAPQTQETMPQNGEYEEWYKYFFGENGPNK